MSCEKCSLALDICILNWLDKNKCTLKELLKETFIFTARKRSCWKVMFSHLSVNHFVHGGGGGGLVGVGKVSSSGSGGCDSACGGSTAPGHTHPPLGHTPRTNASDTHTPLDTPTTTPPPPQLRPTSGRYASFLECFLVLLVFWLMV